MVWLPGWNSNYYVAFLNLFLWAKEKFVESTEEKELTLQDILVIFERRRAIVLGTVLVCFILAALYCIVCTRRYEATGSIQMQKESADAMGLESMMSSVAGGAGDALGANIDLQTQANILQSDTLALKTIASLRLEDTRDFQTHWNPVGHLLSLLQPAGIPDPSAASLDQAPQRRRRALKVFDKNLKVKPVGGTRLIEIRYQNPDPKLAAAVVNTLIQSLVDYTFQTRYDAANQTAKWLNDQLGNLRKNSEDLQAKVANLQSQVGVYGLDTTDAHGQQMAYSGVLERLQQSTEALSAAEQDSIMKGAIARAAASGNAEMLSGLAGNTVGKGSQAMNTALNLIQSLRQQEATAQAALDQAKAKYGPAYSRIDELQGQLEGIRRSIQDEIKRVRGRAQSDYQVSQQTEAGIRAQYEAVKKEAGQLNDKGVEYAIARQDAIGSRSLYEDLQRRLNAAGVLAGLKSSNITVVDPGRVPAKPTKPNVPLYLAIALGGGFFLGSCGAFLCDVLDNKIKDVADLEQTLDKKVLGALPYIEDVESRSQIIMTALPHSSFAEAVRSIRTALLLSRSDTPPKIILVTSSLEAEGKSTFSINLATALAQHGSRVLLIDADLRRGTIADRLKLHASKAGLSAMLSGMIKESAVVTYEQIPGLFVLPAGIIPPNPTELLDSKTMQQYLEQWRTEYDFILLDGAPVLPVTDSVSLNELADATLLIARANCVEKNQIRRSYGMLGRDGKHYVGLVLNGLSENDRSYYGYYGYYGRHGYQNKEDRHA
jgi:polysaccharide biosynthesis transport protein